MAEIAAEGAAVWQNGWAIMRMQELTSNVGCVTFLCTRSPEHILPARFSNGHATLVSAIGGAIREPVRRS